MGRAASRTPGRFPQPGPQPAYGRRSPAPSVQVWQCHRQLPRQAPRTPAVPQPRPL